MIGKRTAFAAMLLVASLPHTANPASALPSIDEAAGRYQIAPTSKISFTVDQIGGGGIKGKFDRFSGTFDLKGGDLSHSMVSFDLDPESVDTGQTRIDNFLRSSAVFDAGHYVRISFRSTNVRQTAPDSAHIEGILTAKGHSNRESFDVRLTRWNGRVISFDVDGNIHRSHYAMDVGTPIYADVVRFDMMIEGGRQ